jgi:hypothetical protein
MERILVTPKMEQRLIEFAGASYVAKISSNSDGPIPQHRPGQTIRVGMGHHGVQNVEVDWDDSYRPHSPWYEFLGDGRGEPIKELIGVFNVRNPLHKPFSLRCFSDLPTIGTPTRENPYTSQSRPSSMSDVVGHSQPTARCIFVLKP